MGKDSYSQSHGFSSSLIQMWSWNIKKAECQRIDCFRIVVLEKTLESPLGCKEIKSVNSKGNQLWIFIGRTDAEAKTLWPLDSKSWFTGKDPDAGKDWRREEKLVAGDEMVGWHHRLGVSQLKDRGAWPAAVHGLANSQTWLSNWTTTSKPCENPVLISYRGGNTTVPQ